MDRSLDQGLVNISSQFFIKYQEKELPKLRKPEILPKPEVKRYSSRQQCDKIKDQKYFYRVSQSALESVKATKVNKSTAPSYLKPTEASICAQLARNRAQSNAQLMQQKKKEQLQKLRSKSLEKEEQNQFQTEYNRVPIQYYDERDYGCGADSLRARVVFRGYAPKNTYYYMKTLKPLSTNPKSILQSIQSSAVNFRNEFELKFESKFQSGNLSAVARMSSSDYYLYMREDTNTHGLRQWYYFQVRNLKSVKVKFRIYKFSKSHSLYRHGLKPYVRVRRPSSHYVLSQWAQRGDKIKYEFDKGQRCFYLEFEYHFEEDNEEVEFAMLPPYTYSMLKDYLKKLESDNQSRNIQKTEEDQKNLDEFHVKLDLSEVSVKTEENKKFCKEKENKNEEVWKTEVSIDHLGSSLAGLNIPYIQIKSTCRRRQTNAREAIFITARTHPGETVSNWSLESFIDRVLELPQLCQYYDFFIIPMVNPDGVFFGNHRTSVIGQDLNRNFHSADLQTFPQVQAVQWAVRELRRSHKIRYVIDLHGHSSRKNIFAYGEQFEINTRQYLNSRILPKILSESISSFKYKYCVFKESKQKKNTARIYFGQKYKINCLTFEQSYGLLDEGPMNVSTWRNFGIALADSLLTYAEMYEKGRESSLSKYLQEQIENEKQQIEKRILKHKKILGIINEGEDESQAKQKIERVKTKTEQLMEKVKTFIQNESKIKQEQQQAELLRKVQGRMNSSESVENGQEGDEKGEEQEEGEEELKDQNYQQYDENSSIATSELSSGDEELELLNDELEGIKKEIVKVGCLKDGLRREKYQIAQNKLELFNSEKRKGTEHGSNFRLHDQKSTMIPRIVKFQMKKKIEYIANIKMKDFSRSKDLIDRDREERRNQIESKFMKMELPSIRR